MRKGARAYATLADVAKEAGVGKTTVSRVINGALLVSPSTLKRVRAAMDKLSFHPNHAARILKGEKTNTIGLIVPSIADSFFSSCAGAAQKVARAHHYAIVLATTNNSQRDEIDNINFLARRTDGLLIVPAHSQSRALADLVQGLPVPVVSFDRPIKASGVTSVMVKNFDGAMWAVHHLVEHGRKRILCLGGETDLYTIRERLRGYRQAMQDARLPLLIDTSVNVESFESTEAAVQKHLAGTTPIDAIFGLKNITTIHAFQVLQKLRVNVPKRVALVGFDDFQLASALRPAVTVIQQPVADLGRLAAEMLFRQLLDDGGPSGSAPKPGTIELEPQLVVRNSCGCNTSSWS